MLTFAQQKVSLASLFHYLPVWSRDMGQARAHSNASGQNTPTIPAASVAGAPNVDHAPLPAWHVSCVGEIWNSPPNKSIPLPKEQKSPQKSWDWVWIHQY